MPKTSALGEVICHALHPGGGRHDFSKYHKGAVGKETGAQKRHTEPTVTIVTTGEAIRDVLFPISSEIGLA